MKPVSVKHANTVDAIVKSEAMLEMIGLNSLLVCLRVLDRKYNKNPDHGLRKNRPKSCKKGMAPWIVDPLYFAVSFQSHTMTTIRTTLNTSSNLVILAPTLFTG
jgi:hypothetical protein